jgi:CHAT domain-containing protein
MRRFYAHLSENPGAYKADAHRRATIETMAVPGWEAFYHWAPFIMIGDWR